MRVPSRAIPPHVGAYSTIKTPADVRPTGVWQRLVFQECPAISTNFRYNEQIRISPIFLIDQDDNKLGSTSTSEALRRARELGLDLVEVAPNARPPVCKIMDFGKWRYQQQKKEDRSRASSRAGQLKELKFRTVKIGEHDLMIKVNHARDFLKEGNKVQFTLQFRGRELAHIDLGRDIFKKIKEELFLCSKVERDAKMEGKRMTMVLQPDHKPVGTPMPNQGGKAPAAPRPTGLVPAKPGAPAPSGERLNIPGRPAPAPAGVGAAPAAAPVATPQAAPAR
jgi:translation initiation factor IF-3